MLPVGSDERTGIRDEGRGVSKYVRSGATAQFLDPAVRRNKGGVSPRQQEGVARQDLFAEELRRSADASAPGGVGPIPLKLASADDDLDPAADALAVVQDEMNRPFDTGRGPLARVTYISGSTGSDLVLTLHHSIADGTSTANLVHEVLDWCGARVTCDSRPAPVQQAPVPSHCRSR
jgi:hypothetical protein